MGDVYSQADGAILRAASDPNDRHGVPIRLDDSPDARLAVDALRAIAARRIDVNLAELQAEWAKIDQRALNLLEDWHARSLRETAEMIAEALLFLEELAPIVDDDDDDGGGGAPEPSPDPAESQGA